MAAELVLEDGGAVVPGQERRLALEVTNTGDVVDEIELSVLGAALAWTSVQPPASACSQETPDTRRSTYIGALVGAGGGRGAGVTTNMRILLCADASCSKVLAEARPKVVNYGLTEATFEVAVTSGTTYFARWYKPDAPSPNGGWDMYWWAGSTGPGPARKPISEAQRMHVVVKGYNR